MKVLVSITSWSPDKKKYLDMIIEAYSKWTKYIPTIVLAVNYPYETNVIVIPSIRGGWDHCWNNKEYLQQNYQDYDLIIEQDDDIMITETNLDYYVTNQYTLPDYKDKMYPNRIDANGSPKKYMPGFLVAEGDYLISLKQPHFPFIDEKFTIGSGYWIVPHIGHSACFIVDKDRYSIFLKNTDNQPKRIKGHSIGATARTEIYNIFNKMVLVDGIKDKSALVQHLPIKYVNGTPNFNKWKFTTVNTIDKYL